MCDGHGSLRGVALMAWVVCRMLPRVLCVTSSGRPSPLVLVAAQWTKGRAVWGVCSTAAVGYI